MKKYLAEYPNDVDMHLRLGYILSRFKKRFEESIASLERVIELDPENLSGTLKLANNYLGHAYLYIDQFDLAIEALRRYQTLAPESSDPLHSIADAYRLTGAYREAIEKYNEIITSNPGYLFSYEGLGYAYLALGKWKQALNAFTRYCNEAPESKIPYGHFLLGCVYLLQDDYVSASAEAEYAQKLEPPRFSSYWLNGMISLSTPGNLDSAIEILDTMEKLKMDPDVIKGLAYYHHLQGRILLAQELYADGLRALQQAVEFSLRDESIYFRKELARAYMVAGRLAEAKQEIERLQPFNDNDAEVYFILGEIYEKEGSINESTYYFKKAANIWKDADTNFHPLTLLKEKLGESM
jgi:tetratricopeptide (TPR) repeat protein